MKACVLMTLFFFTTAILFSQNNLIGDTINKYVLGDTVDIEITDIPEFSNYEVEGGGLIHDSVSTEIFILKKKKDRKHLIVVTILLKMQDSIYSNLIYDIIETELENNQKLEFQFCSYKGKENPNIIAQMEEGEINHLYNKVVKGWEIKGGERKVVNTDIKETNCSIDERK